MKGVWISFLEWETVSFKSAETFAAQFLKMAGNAKSRGLDTLIVHLRPFADALYQSTVFPWSHLITGRQGIAPDYDPLSIMLDSAHANELRLEAWINPYRILSPVREIELARTHPAVKWQREDKGNRHQHVLEWEGGLYFNPGDADVQRLIVAGAKELVEKYQIDGLHIDDYFYPTTDSSFDRGTWQSQIEEVQLAMWRRNQVNTLVRALYQVAADAQKTFGISPMGDVHLNYAQQFSDVSLWLREKGYADYIMPQLYYSLSGSPSFRERADEWAKLQRHRQVKLYAGVGAYCATPKEYDEMMKYLSSKPAYLGYALFRYDSIFSR